MKCDNLAENVSTRKQVGLNNAPYGQSEYGSTFCYNHEAPAVSVRMCIHLPT
ncbi:hypothetical protein DPMN_184613 [Dreissena polymorpha]|uniref:Uncharacterized protein n=1 Tax=Dreissena polymorpha TaxID=45954 RepID=A0A9D4DL86_DREPO|nr:hypothetical protein DPMN_184613 [Dreissena polymorpha]